MTTTRKAEPSIHELLVQIMRDVPFVEKSQYNKTQKFAFRGVDDLVRALGPKLREYGILHYPTVIDSWRRETESRKGDVMHAVALRVRYTFIGPAGDRIDDVVVEGESIDSNDKGTPKAMSVAWRIALIQLFALPTDEPDPDSDYYDERSDDRERRRDDREDRRGEQRRPSRRSDRVNDEDERGRVRDERDERTEDDEGGDPDGDDDTEDDETIEAREIELKTLKRKVRELELDRDQVAERYATIFGEELVRGDPTAINRFTEFIVAFGQLPAETGTSVRSTQHPDVPRLLREGADPATARENVKDIRATTRERIEADRDDPPRDAG